MSNETEDKSVIVRGNKLFWGILCLMVGVLLLLDIVFRINLFSMGNLWPLFVLIPGLCLESVYFDTKKAPALLIPGGILTVIGLLFFFEVATGWRFAAVTWPVYILAVAVGLYQFYLSSGKPRAILVAVSILGLVSGISIFDIVLTRLSSVLHHNLAIPIALICIGGLILFAGPGKKDKKNQ